jgi:hypothetical protein
MNQNPDNPLNPVQNPGSVPAVETGNSNPEALSVPSVPSSSVPSVSPPQKRPGRPLSRLLCLSERQLEHINSWLKDGVPYREIVKLCSDHFQKEIPRMTFVRYANRRELARELQLDEIADAKEAAAEFSKFAVTGDSSFSTNTLALLEEQAFDLALAHQRDGDADDLSTLKKLWDLIHKAKSTHIRERHATVQERKCDLRAKELELKHQLAATRVNSANPNHFNNSEYNPESSAQKVHNHGRGTFHPCPTLTSRDAANQREAAKADQETNTTPSSTQDSALIANPFESVCSLSPEVRAENQRYAELLLSGQIETHYKRDPANSLLAKICNWPMPAAASAQTTAITPRSADSLSASTKTTDTENPTTNSNDQPSALNQTTQNQPDPNEPIQNENQNQNVNQNH